jgi:GMP synthase-like glutamine amidotransferase
VKALCVLHDHLSSSGHVGARLKDLGWEVEEILVVPAECFEHPDVACAFPDPSGFDLLVVLGAPWSAYDDELIGRWLDEELAWLRTAVKTDIPVLGICFGAQALARALGGEVRPAERTEIGWVQIVTSDQHQVPAGPWFQWHGDQFFAPANATELATSPAGCQAFRIGRSLAVQFHPELTPAGLDLWLDNGAAQKARSHGLDLEALREATLTQAPQARARAHRLVDVFLWVSGLTADRPALQPSLQEGR